MNCQHSNKMNVPTLSECIETRCEKAKQKLQMELAFQDLGPNDPLNYEVHFFFVFLLVYLYFIFPFNARLSICQSR